MYGGQRPILLFRRYWEEVEMCELGRNPKSRFGSRVQVAIVHRTDRIAAILDVDFRDM